MNEDKIRFVGKALKKAGELLEHEPSEQALLTEYQVCEQDNEANSQSYWTLAAIFIGLSTALLGGLLYAVITNDTLLNLLINMNETVTIRIVSIIALILGISMIIILQKLRGWLSRIQFNQRINQERMREIELELGMKMEWRKLAVNKWNEISRCKRNKIDNPRKRWSILRKKLKDEINPKYHTQLKELKEHLLYLVSNKSNRYYETRSSKKHFPWIIQTLMFLWVLIVTSALFSIIRMHTDWYWGFIAVVIVAAYCIDLLIYISKMRVTEERPN